MVIADVQKTMGACYRQAMILEHKARALTTGKDTGRIARSVMEAWAHKLLGQLQTKAATEGIPTRHPLSPITQVIKGDAKYSFDSGKFWGSFTVRGAHLAYWANVKIVAEKSHASHVSSRGRKIEIGQLMSCLDHRGFVFNKPEHVQAILRFLWARTRQLRKEDPSIEEFLRRVPPVVTGKRSRAVIVVFPRPLVPSGLLRAAREELMARLAAALRLPPTFMVSKGT